MQIIIIDPSLEAISGHHHLYTASLTREALSRGAGVTILANRAYPEATIAGATVVRHFSQNAYPAPWSDPVRGHYDEIKARNDTYLEELSQLPVALFPPGSLVLFPTASEYHLYATVLWAETFQASASPQFVAFLMLNSGVELSHEPGLGLQVVNPVRALFYKLALDHGKSLGPRFAFFGTGASHAAEFSALAGFDIAPHPLITNVDALSKLPRNQTEYEISEKRVLLFAGDAKLDKGLHLVPSVAKALQERFPDTTLVVHANFTTAWGPVAELQTAIEDLGKNPRILVDTGYMSADAYVDLLASCSAAIFMYDPAEYKKKSSGVLWEALALGLPIVAPADTWLVNEVEYWRGSVSSYEDWTEEGVAAAAIDMIATLNSRLRKSVAVGNRFREINTVRANMDLVCDTWVRSAWLRSHLQTSRDVRLDLGSLANDQGWYQVETGPEGLARWLGNDARAYISLPPALSWTVRVSGFYGTEEALKSTQLFLDGVPAKDPIFALAADGKWSISCVYAPKNPTVASKTELRMLANTRVLDDGREVSLYCNNIVFGDPRTALASRPKLLASLQVSLSRGHVEAVVSPQGKSIYRVTGPAGGDAVVPLLQDVTLRIGVGKATHSAEHLSVRVNGCDLPTELVDSGVGPELYCKISSLILRDASQKMRFELVPSKEATLPIDIARLSIEFSR